MFLDCVNFHKLSRQIVYKDSDIIYDIVDTNQAIEFIHIIILMLLEQILYQYNFINSLRTTGMVSS